MTIKVGINGFGRIGRTLTRIVPTTTGPARATGEVIPELGGEAGRRGRPRPGRGRVAHRPAKLAGERL